MALAPTWTSSTTSFFHHVTAWEWHTCLLKLHSLLHLNNMLTLHSNLTAQAQQPLYLLRPCPVALHICMMMMSFDHEEVLLPFVKIVSLTIVQYKYKYSLQWYSLQYKDNSQHSTGYNSTKPTALPLPGKSQRTHLSTINVHSNRPKDSAHFAQPMSDNSTSSYCSMSPLIHICNDSPASSACIVPYTSWQYARAVPNVDIVGSY